MESEELWDVRGELVRVGWSKRAAVGEWWAEPEREAESEERSWWEVEV